MAIRGRDIGERGVAGIGEVVSDTEVVESSEERPVCDVVDSGVGLLTREDIERRLSEVLQDADLDKRLALEYLKEYNKLQALYADKNASGDVVVELAVGVCKCEECGHLNELRVERG